MTTKRVIYRRSDGIVEVVVPGLQRMSELMTAGNSEDEAIAIIQSGALAGLAERGFGPAEDVEVMDEAQIPQTRVGDRAFRNALEKPGLGPPIVNITKAREIHAERVASALLFESRRLEDQEATARIAGRTADADKAASDAIAIGAVSLANLATQIAAAPNPTALSAIWPVNVPR